MVYHRLYQLYTLYSKITDMLLKLTEQNAGIINPDIVITNELLINTKYLQSIRKALPRHPFKEEYSVILMGSGHVYNVKESFDYINNKITEEWDSTKET